ncbi:MAG TPA: glycerate kinase [Candidatus Hydrogenedentes bacterium]|nr:glycerate kinase [Candidatus Hydrogenedentota bacterium]
MQIIIAPDSFKESASSLSVATALAEGWRRIYPEADLRLIPMADGGEGTAEAILAAAHGQKIDVTVTDPLGDPVSAYYVLLEDTQTAIVEMALASGLPLVPPAQRNPECTTTFGTGQLIRHALESGARKIIVGIGGSATNDGGAGMAQALGYSLLDNQGCELPTGGAALARLHQIDSSKKHPALDSATFLVACDVDNPLCGPQGASHVYGPQKGADPAMAEHLDEALMHFGAVIEKQLGVNVLTIPGAGAAGGLGAGLIAFTRAQLRPGVALIAEACGLSQHLAGADLVITGEGRIDRQSAHGKTPVGVAQLAKRHNIPVIAVAGALGPGYESVYDHGIDVVWPICGGPMTLSEAIAHTETRLRDTGEAIARAWRAFTK